jgi:hypothetical protein
MVSETSVRDSLVVAAMIILGAYGIGTIGAVFARQAANGAFSLTLAAIALAIVLLLGAFLWRSSIPPSPSGDPRENV